MDGPEWITVDELAVRYRRSAYTIRRWIKQGKFGKAAVKTPGGAWLVKDIPGLIIPTDRGRPGLMPLFKPALLQSPDKQEKPKS